MADGLSAQRPRRPQVHGTTILERSGYIELTLRTTAVDPYLPASPDGRRHRERRSWSIIRFLIPHLRRRRLPVVGLNSMQAGSETGGWTGTGTSNPGCARSTLTSGRASRA